MKSAVTSIDILCMFHFTTFMFISLNLIYIYIKYKYIFTYIFKNVFTIMHG